MANRYWVGGSGTWDGSNTTNWSATSGGIGGVSVPTSADAVFFDANSGGSGTVVSVASGNTGAGSINCTGFTETVSVDSVLTVSGSVTLSSAMTLAGFATLIINASGTITSNGNTTASCPLRLINSGSVVQLADAFTTSGDFTVSGATFTTNNHNVTASRFGATVFGGTLNLGSSTVSVSASGTTFINNAFQVSTFATVNAGTSTINLTGDGWVGFSGGNKTYYNVAFTNTTPRGEGAPQSVLGANTFNQLSIAAPAAAGLRSVQFGGNQTITTLICAGAAANQRIELVSDTFGTARTLTVATYTTKQDVDFSDIVAAGASAPWSGTRLGNLGGNSNITFPAAKTVYWNLAGSSNWSDNGWAATSGGSPAVANFPLAQDTAVIDNSSAGSSITVNALWGVGSLNASSKTTSISLSTTDSSFYLRVLGNLSLGSGVTGSSLNVRFVGSGTQTISVTNSVGQIRLVGRSNTLSLQNNLALPSRTFVLEQGTLQTNDYNLTASSFLSSYSSTRAINAGTSTLTFSGGWTVSSSGFTFTGSSSTIKVGGDFYGAGLSYGTLDFAAPTTVRIQDANTFANITNTQKTVGACTLTLYANQTVLNFTASGELTRLLTLNSDTAGVQRTLTKTSGTIAVEYLILQDSNATGGATWNATSSIDAGNNSGWNITAPLVSGGNMLMMFV